MQTKHLNADKNADKLGATSPKPCYHWVWLVEVASTTCADIIEEFYNSAIFTTKITTK